MIVFDPKAPVDGPDVNGWAADYVTSDFKKFLEIYWGSRNCYAVIDESLDLMALWENTLALRKIAYRGSGQGHVNCFISQSRGGLDKVVRDQANELFLFIVDDQDALKLAKGWNCPILAEAHKLRPFEYIHLRRHGLPSLGRL